MCCLSQEKTVRTTIDADSLRSEIRDKSVRVIDVRREEDYKQNHIPTAVNLPLANLLSDDSPDRVIKLAQSMGIDDETPVVVYDDTFGALASRVAWTLEYVGHSDVSLLVAFLSTIGLIIILTLGLTIYGVATFGQEKSTGNPNDLQTKKAWDEFKGGFFVGACGSAGFAFICLSNIPTFTAS